jgi:ketosteroid isomerase-like protein
MSASDQIALAREMLEALNAQDDEAVLVAMHEDVELVPLIVDIEGGPFRGHDGVRRWLAARAEVWGTMRVEQIDLRTVGNVVLGRGVLSGVAQGSGVAIAEPIFGVLRFRGDLVAWIGFFRTEAEALESAGID